MITGAWFTGAVTVTVISCVILLPPAVAVTVNEYVPAVGSALLPH